MIYHLIISLFLFNYNNEVAESPPVTFEVETDSSELLIVDWEGLKPWLYQENDKVIVVNFWATWCAPCVKELPYFEDLHEVYSDDEVEVILVSLDFKNQIEKKLKPFIKKNNLVSKVIVLDDSRADYWIDQVSPEWSGAIPATVVYRNEHREFFERSFHSLDELEQIVKPFINK